MGHPMPIIAIDERARKLAIGMSVGEHTFVWAYDYASWSAVNFRRELARVVVGQACPQFTWLLASATAAAVVGYLESRIRCDKENAT
jgi:hypothetical protein